MKLVEALNSLVFCFKLNLTSFQLSKFLFKEFSLKFELRVWFHVYCFKLRKRLLLIFIFGPLCFLLANYLLSIVITHRHCEGSLRYWAFVTWRSLPDYVKLWSFYMGLVFTVLAIAGAKALFRWWHNITWSGH